MIVYLISYVFILMLVFNTRNLTSKQSTYLFAIFIIIIGAICGFRDMLGGYDSYIYAEVFDLTSDEIDRGISPVLTFAFEANEKEQGFALFNVLIAYITGNRYIYLLFINIFIFTSIFIHIKRLSKNPLLSVFILFCMFYFFSFTYLRQVMAACIAWYAIPYAVKRKPIQFFLIVILAVSFHNSAALFGLVYFIANQRFSRSQILLLIAFSTILGLTPIGTYLFRILGGSLNEMKAESVIEHVADTARIEYILEAGFFFFLIFISYEKIAEDKLSTCMLNVALLFMFVLTFFAKFSDGGRMSWFFLIGIAVIIAQIAENENNSSMFKFATVFVASVLYFRVLTSWGGILMPYKSFLSDGVRPDDTTWAMYEYDHGYDTDKFYRPVFKGFEDK